MTAALEQLAAIYARLKGDVSVLFAARENLLLPVDLVHEPSGTVIAVDELPHFTSFRLTALELYAPTLALGFELEEYESLCRAWCSTTDGLARGLPAKGFGFGGVQRERAYHDALLDLGAPAMGHPPRRPGRGGRRRRRGRLPAAPVSARWRFLPLTSRPGPGSSVTATLTVRQRPQRTRTLYVICSGFIETASTLPHSTQT